MNSAKSDLIRRHLHGAGLSNDDCARYTQLLRMFLAARLTKALFEIEMLKIIPREKISTHNAIIRELLFRAQQKREGVPDLPVVMPTPEKQAARPVPAPKPPKPEPVAEPEPVKSAPIAPPPPPPPAPKAPRPKPDTKDIVPKPTPEEQPPIPPPARPVPDPRIPLPTVAPLPRPPPVPTLSCNDVPTYNQLPFFPVAPGQGMDLGLFLKLRQRMKRIVVEDMGLVGGVRDDAVALVLQGLEAHVKSILEAAVRQRVGREMWRPRGGSLVCGPLSGFDLREASTRNANLLGEECSTDLERLSMLLF